MDHLTSELIIGQLMGKVDAINQTLVTVSADIKLLAKDKDLKDVEIRTSALEKSMAENKGWQAALAAIFGAVAGNIGNLYHLVRGEHL